jgi:hypothetical protein
MRRITFNVDTAEGLEDEDSSPPAAVVVGLGVRNRGLICRVMSVVLFFAVTVSVFFFAVPVSVFGRRGGCRRGDHGGGDEVEVASTSLAAARMRCAPASVTCP